MEKRNDGWLFVSTVAELQEAGIKNEAGHPLDNPVLHPLVGYDDGQINSVGLKAEDQDRNEVVVPGAPHESIVADKQWLKSFITKAASMVVIWTTAGDAERTPILIRDVGEVVSFSRRRRRLLG